MKNKNFIYTISMFFLLLDQLIKLIVTKNMELFQEIKHLREENEKTVWLPCSRMVPNNPTLQYLYPCMVSLPCCTKAVCPRV